MFYGKNFRSKLAFTVSELMMTIGIIGVIASITLPIIIKSIPSKEEKLHQKATYLIEELAVHLYDNDAYYPRTADTTKLGFKNTDEVTVDGIKYGGGTVNSLARKQKFCHLFAHQFSNVNHGSVTCPEDIDSENPSFRSADGIDWWIPKTTFEENTNGQVKGFAKIKVDVNGKDKGQNCTEGAVNCTKPDIYYYYIKTNGTVTLSNPISVNENAYEIIVQPTTKDQNGNVISSVNGNVIEIAPINSDGSFGEFSSAAEDFANLTPNTSYVLRAKPTSGYISNWGTKPTNVQEERRYGYKKVRTSKVKNYVSLEFREINTYCIKLKVNCPTTNISNCVDTAEYKYDCKYTNVGTGNGDYVKTNENFDIFKYVGTGSGNYSYGCEQTGNLTVGSNATGDAGYLKACGLETGDYQLYVTPAANMHIFPEINSYYQQNVRLGTSDLTDFQVEIRY